jgi:hypothetical protein
MVQCTFGVLRNRWRIFRRAIDVCPDFCDVIVKICGILHNVVCQRDSFQFQDTLYECPLESIKAVGTRGNVTGMDVREYFATYFTSPLGSVLGQYEKVWSIFYYKYRKCSYLFRTNTAYWQHSVWYYNTFIKFTFTCWLQGVLYFILLCNAVKVYKEIIKEYSTVCTNKLRWA